MSVLMTASVLVATPVSATTNDSSNTGAYITADENMLCAITDCTMRLSIGSYIYDGKAKKPTARIYIGKNSLVKGTDYTISYKNNVNVGTATAVITGKGKYFGSKSLNFIISKESKPFTECSVTLPKDTFEYDGSYHEPEVIVKDGTRTLVKNCDYTVSCENSINAGTAAITVTGRGIYTGKVKRNFTITRKKIDDTESMHFDFDITQNGHSGLNVIVMDNDKKLRGGEDYGVSISPRCRCGFCDITIKGLGNYSGIIEFQAAYDSTHIMVLPPLEEDDLFWGHFCRFE